MDKHIRQLERQANTGDPEAQAKLDRARERANILPDNTIVIDGENYHVDAINVWEGEDLIQIAVSCDHDEDMEFILAPDAETAGKTSRQRWADMVENDPAEFRAMVGDENILRWAMGQSAGPGSVHVTSLEAWLDLHINTPEEEWACYDGAERDVEGMSSDLAETLIDETGTKGYEVAYRCN